MGYYENVYLKRLNRFGLDYQSRIQGQREKVFEDLLKKSIYRVDFVYNNEIVPGLLERYKQDTSETIQYLLLRVDMDIPAGTILRIPNKNYEYGADLTDENSYLWMIYYLENIKASGYNRYIVLKMTHEISWKDGDETRTATGYFYGPETSAIIDTLKSRMGSTVYNEPTTVRHFITPFNQYIKKDDYFVIHPNGNTEISEGYVVDGFDTQSTPGVEYVTIDPAYVRDESEIEIPTVIPEDEKDEYYWLTGGENE